jgi:RNA polymerase sigma-70 factor (ECF subfamily)
MPSPPPAPPLRRLDPTDIGGHRARLHASAMALCGSPHEADDLVQDACLRVLGRPRFLHGDDDLGYLLRVLRNTFLDARRAAARRPSVPSDPEDLERTAGRSTDPQRAVEIRELCAAIHALPDHHRQVVAAVDVLGLSYDEAARALGVPAGTVMSRLSRARGTVAARCAA